MQFKLTKQQLILDLYSAFYCAKRHKANKSYVLKFLENLDEEIRLLADELYDHTYVPLPSSCFIIEYPKKREVFAAQFRDRVIHHLYFNYVHEMFERTFIQDTYSCIKDRGTHYGIKRLEQHMRQESNGYSKPCYVLKFDIRGYFMHIKREKLLEITSNTIISMSTHRIYKKLPQTWGDILDIDFILWLTKSIIMSDPIDSCVIAGSKDDWEGLDYNKSLFNAPEGYGLPIGNLTSLLLSNVYLNIYDLYMKRIIGCKHYGRYVDDSYVVSSDKPWLLSIILRVKLFLKDNLYLELNLGKIRLTSVNHGVEFLGAFIKPHRIYINNTSLNRMVKNVQVAINQDNEKAWLSINSFLGVLQHYSSYNIRCKLFLTPQMLYISSYDRDVRKMKVIEY